MTEDRETHRMSSDFEVLPVGTQSRLQAMSTAPAPLSVGVSNEAAAQIAGLRGQLGAAQREIDAWRRRAEASERRMLAVCELLDRHREGEDCLTYAELVRALELGERGA